jgi:hypothetical protein
MRRYHQEIALMDQQRRVAVKFKHGKLERSRFRKRKALDCGHTQCCGCHYDKVFDITAPATQRSDDTFRQQLAEL